MLQWHDVQSPLSAVRYPKIKLDEIRTDESNFLRKKIIREQEIFKFGKMGVSRTIEHGLGPNYPDCEYTSLTAIVDALDKFPSDDRDNIVKFFDQAGDRLFRDADLLGISDVITILNSHMRCEYMNLRLFAKLRNEIIYDVDKIFSIFEIAIIMNVYSHFNITSPRLQRALVDRGLTILKEGENIGSISDLCLAVTGARKSYPQHNPTCEFVHALLNSIREIGQEDVPTLALALRMIIERPRADVSVISQYVKPILDSLLKHSMSDIETASNVMFVASRMGVVGDLEKVVSVVKANQEGLSQSFLQVPKKTAQKNASYIESRNRASEILGRLLCCSEWCPSEIHELVSSESVRGMKTRQLGEILAMTTERNIEIIRKELERRNI